MKTIIFNIIKALCDKIMYKICPWKRKAFILLKLDRMTPDEIDYIRNFLNCIYEYPSAFKTNDYTPVKDDLCESLRAINKYYYYRKESKVAALIFWLSKQKRMVLRLLF